MFFRVSLGRFVLVLLAFVVFDLVSSVLSQEIGLPSWTIARNVSSELLGFCFYLSFFSFLCRALD